MAAGPIARVRRAEDGEQSADRDAPFRGLNGKERSRAWRAGSDEDACGCLAAWRLGKSNNGDNLGMAQKNPVGATPIFGFKIRDRSALELDELVRRFLRMGTIRGGSHHSSEAATLAAALIVC